MAKPLARVFSGIQPSGIPHLGNYFGAIRQWIQLVNDGDLNKYNIENVTRSDFPAIYCIVDMHAYSSPKVQYGHRFYNNVLATTASLLALGLRAEKCILFRQSDILEHNYLDNVFQNFVSTQRLMRMNQYRDKTRHINSSKGVLNGLLTYPVLQAADILLYKANLVPVGEDQIQHIELTRDIAKRFNSTTSCDLFPEPSPMLHHSTHARRIRSLRDPSKKMSKSDPAHKSFIEVIDEPDTILEKIKKAVTDSTSRVYYDAENRPGVSNLMRIHSLATGDTIEQLQEECSKMDTAAYKLVLADVLIDYFKPARDEYRRIQTDSGYVEEVLRLGRERARPLALETVLQVKKLLGSINPDDIAREPCGARAI